MSDVTTQRSTDDDDPGTPLPQHAGQRSNAEDRGLASLPAPEISALVLPSWDAFIAIAERCELDAPVRLPGWRVREVLVHLGSWDDGVALERMLGEAAASARGELAPEELERPHSTEENNAAVFARHLGEPREAVLEALRSARAEVATFLEGPLCDELGLAEARTLLGPLPLLTVLIAGAYELAVHSLDLVSAGAPRPPEHLLDAGVAALVDTTGALAARHGIAASLAGVTPAGGWQFRAGHGGWTTQRVPSSGVDGAALEASAHVLLDASAGRVSVPALLARRELRPHHVPGLLRLAPLVEEVPGLPGGAALRGAVRHLEQVNRLVRRLPLLGRR